MKKVFFLIFLVLFVVGCAKKEVAIDEAPKVQQEEEPVQENVAKAPEPKKKDILQDGTVVGSVYFAYDQYNIPPSMSDVIDSSVEKINENPDMNVVVEGNTDEFGSDEYNFALSNKRAMAVQSALITRGISKNKISILSLGKTKPVCTEKREECYQKNRRGDIRLIKANK
ncbi:OmpA family protein [Helicobacter mustelae]|uniref:Peptidoglycan associated lipoprotein (Omp18) n=1 Tax=Helicobacter mustelae (strain ATCC 43772 / CCUG 25715 / CIP 103759 / LMG 18044 / NCTC 12198 / R85-136P) TaxID=679897 RepID=D3UGT2_HELM1|nr:OmpA family protein [Helicobacter mustelae]CBG39703.1 peptidoglycan associated lipoprotein (omp18) [Helicobacter mustelae 12198]SQH71209.1 peptidoglycan associated lipoprotein [Helicobacter mustelae]